MPPPKVAAFPLIVFLLIVSVLIFIVDAPPELVALFPVIVLPLIVKVLPSLKMPPAVSPLVCLWGGELDREES